MHSTIHTSARAFQPASSLPLTNTHITIDPSHLGPTVSPDFAGFSIETANVCSILSQDQHYPSFAQLFKNLGPAIMRFGGNTVDASTWMPNGALACNYKHTVINKAAIDAIFAFARKVGWKVIWGVNLKLNNPSLFAGEAAYAASSGGSSLLAIEFGNEPDRYGISFSQYIANWEAYYNALRQISNAPISGPGTGSLNQNWFTMMLQYEASKLTIATRHWYINSKKSHPTITDLLSKQSMRAAATMFDIEVPIAQQHSLPFQLNETNSYSDSGAKGVSNVFASALWGADYMLSAADHGVLRLNVHGVPNTPNGNSKGHINYYSPIDPNATPTPLYYAMLMFHYAAADGSTVPLQLRSSINVAAHSVLNSGGAMQIIIVNKDQVNTAAVAINTTRSYSRATAIRLLAPSISATTGVTLGGSPIAPDGTWTPSVYENIPLNGPNSSVSLPPGSAMVITYQ